MLYINIEARRETTTQISDNIKIAKPYTLFIYFPTSNQQNIGIAV
jgi:hypothetical protein